jgi:hypothetical protein
MKLRRSLLTSVALILAVLGTAVPSDAKCPFARYRLSFRIVEETTGTPVAGASVAVLANASDQELAKQDAAAAETGADGVIAAEYRFNTYSSLSLFGAHRCKERIKTLVVVVRHPRYRERRVTLTAKELSVRPTSDPLTFDAVLRTIEISLGSDAILPVRVASRPRIADGVTSEEVGQRWRSPARTAMEPKPDLEARLQLRPSALNDFAAFARRRRRVIQGASVRVSD